MNSAGNALTLADFKNKKKQGCVIIDTRPVQEFIKGFIPGAVHLPVNTNFQSLVKLFFAENDLVLANAFPDDAGAELLYGNLKIEGFLEGGMQTWTGGGQRTDIIIDIEAEEFALDLPFDEKLLILDVRNAEKYTITHVTGAIHMPLHQFADLANLAKFEDDWNIYLYGENDSQSATAISLMQRQGFYNVRNISGGFKSILKLDSIPVEKGKPSEDF